MSCTRPPGEENTFLGRRAKLNIYFLIKAPRDVTGAQPCDINEHIWRKDEPPNRTLLNTQATTRSLSTFCPESEADSNLEWDHQSLLNFKHLLDWRPFFGTDDALASDLAYTYLQGPYPRYPLGQHKPSTPANVVGFNTAINSISRLIIWRSSLGLLFFFFFVDWFGC